MEELKNRAPAIFAKSPASSCSEKFAMIPTIDAINALRTIGFVPTTARQDNKAISSWDKESHARHVVHLRALGTERASAKLGILPELVILNASDGTTRFEMELGVYRLVCSNGMVAFQSEERLTSIHKRTTVEEVIAKALRISDRVKPVLDQIKRWDSIKLTPKKAEQMATRALALRGLGEGYDAKALLVPKRPEDEGDTLWRVLNRIQERSMRGEIIGARTLEDGRVQRLSARPITAIARDFQFNKDLWALAAEVETQA